MSLESACRRMFDRGECEICIVRKTKTMPFIFTIALCFDCLQNGIRYINDLLQL